MTHDDNPFGPVIFRYTRADAIGDGTLVDVSRHAHLACGYDKRVPVAITQTVHEWCASRTDEAGRLANERSVLLAARRAMQGAREESFATFDHPGFPDYGLRVEIGPGDTGEPVLTIGIPWDF